MSTNAQGAHTRRPKMPPFVEKVLAALQMPNRKRKLSRIISEEDQAMVLKLLSENYPLPLCEEYEDRHCTLLHFAVYEGRPDYVNMLLDARCDVDTHDSVGMTPLEWAVQGDSSHSYEIAKLLVSKGASVNHAGPSSAGGLFPLSIAAAQEYSLPFVKLLVEHKADVNQKDANGWTPLMWAIHSDQTPKQEMQGIRVARLLLDRGAQVDVADSKEKQTMLHWAAGWGKALFVRAFLQEKHQANIRNANGHTPFQLMSLSTPPPKEQRQYAAVCALLRAGVRQDAFHVCDVCTLGMGRENDTFLKCTGKDCRVTVHRQCTYVSDEVKLDSQTWLCDVCAFHGKKTNPKCELCPSTSHRAMHCVEGGTWVHAACCMFLDVQLSYSKEDPSRVFVLKEHLQEVPPERFQLKCIICDTTGSGACLQCFHGRCMDAYHITCAVDAGIRLLLTHAAEVSVPLITSFCFRHNYMEFNEEKRIQRYKSAAGPRVPAAQAKGAQERVRVLKQKVPKVKKIKNTESKKTLKRAKPKTKPRPASKGSDDSSTDHASGGSSGSDSDSNSDSDSDSDTSDSSQSDSSDNESDSSSDSSESASGKQSRGSSRRGKLKPKAKQGLNKAISKDKGEAPVSVRRRIRKKAPIASAPPDTVKDKQMTDTVGPPSTTPLSAAPTPPLVRKSTNAPSAVSSAPAETSQPNEVGGVTMQSAVQDIGSDIVPRLKRKRPTPAIDEANRAQPAAEHVVDEQRASSVPKRKRPTPASEDADRAPPPLERPADERRTSATNESEPPREKKRRIPTAVPNDAVGESSATGSGSGSGIVSLGIQSAPKRKLRPPSSVSDHGTTTRSDEAQPELRKTVPPALKPIKRVSFSANSDPVSPVPDTPRRSPSEEKAAASRSVRFADDVRARSDAKPTLSRISSPRDSKSSSDQSRGFSNAKSSTREPPSRISPDKQTTGLPKQRVPIQPLPQKREVSTLAELLVVKSELDALNSQLVELAATISPDQKTSMLRNLLERGVHSKLMRVRIVFVLQGGLVMCKNWLLQLLVSNLSRFVASVLDSLVILSTARDASHNRTQLRLLHMLLCARLCGEGVTLRALVARLTKFEDPVGKSARELDAAWDSIVDPTLPDAGDTQRAYALSALLQSLGVAQPFGTNYVGSRHMTDAVRRSGVAIIRPHVQRGVMADTKVEYLAPSSDRRLTSKDVAIARSEEDLQRQRDAVMASVRQEMDELKVVPHSTETPPGKSTPAGVLRSVAAPPKKRSVRFANDVAKGDGSGEYAVKRKDQRVPYVPQELALVQKVFGDALEGMHLLKGTQGAVSHGS